MLDIYICEVYSKRLTLQLTDKFRFKGLAQMSNSNSLAEAGLEPLII